MAVVRAWLALGGGALLLAGGCETVGSCRHPLTDTTAVEVPPLKMPDGLDGPDTTKALEIPPLKEPEVKRGKGDACLQDPPPMREPGSQTPPAVENPAGSSDGGSGAEAPPKRRGPVSPPR